MGSSRKLILDYARDSSSYSTNSSSSTILPSHFSTYLTAACFIFVTLFFCVCYRRRCTSRRIDHYHDREYDRAGGLGLDLEVVKSFPLVNHKQKQLLGYGDGDEEEEEECCVVCLRHYEEGETLRLVLPCKHLFHGNCIETWLLSHTTCPLCRTNLATSHHLFMPPQIAAAAATTATATQPFDPESHPDLGLGSKGEMRRCHSIGHSSCPIKSPLIIRAYSMDLRHSGALHQAVEEDKGKRTNPAHFFDPR